MILSTVKNFKYKLRMRNNPALELPRFHKNKNLAHKIRARVSPSLIKKVTMDNTKNNIV